MARRKRRWSDNDKHLGPFTWAASDSAYKRVGFMLDSGDGDDYANCHLRLYVYWGTLLIEMPNWLLRPSVEHVPTPNGGYTERHSCEYGAFYVEKAVHMHYGAQTHNSRTGKSKIWFVPWLDWRCVSHRVCDADGKVIYDTEKRPRLMTEGEGTARDRLKDGMKKAKFLFADYDGEHITATVHIEEWEWKRGTGWFRWLGAITPRMRRRAIDIRTDKEFGPRKGSWKGGTIGTGHDILPGQSVEEAFKAWCQAEGRTSSRREAPVTYIGPV
jgi:hypothetical protein